MAAWAKHGEDSFSLDLLCVCALAFAHSSFKQNLVSIDSYLVLFALLKMFAPRYNRSDLFYRKGLREFLAACGVRGTSCDTVAQDTVSHEVVGEGPRRIIFDLETIREIRVFRKLLPTAAVLCTRVRRIRRIWNSNGRALHPKSELRQRENRLN